MRRIGLVVSALVALAFIGAGPARAVERPVADETSFNLALRQAGPGDRIVVADGHYGPKTLRKSGAKDLYLTIAAEHPGQAVIHGGESALNVQSSGWIVLDGLRFTEGSSYGLRTGTCGHVSVLRCIADHNGVTGFFLGSTTDLVVEDSEASANAVQHGIYLNNRCDRVTVRRCVLKDNGTCGIQSNGGMKNVTIEKCVVTGNGAVLKGAAVNVISTKGVSIRENLIGVDAEGRVVGNLFGGIGLTSSAGVTISGNTIRFLAGQGQRCISLESQSEATYSGNTLQVGRPGGVVNVHNGATLTDGGANVVIPMAVKSDGSDK